MPNEVLRTNRRQALRGLGGFTVALPFLPSVLRSSEVRAATSRPKNFVMMGTGHGTVLGNNYFPGEHLLSASEQLPGAHQIRAGMLAAKIDGEQTVLSPTLRAPSSLLTPKLVEKMNILRGVDIAFDVGHQTGALLGNYARNNGSTPGGSGPDFYIPTIDQIMAWSPNFYGDLAYVRERSIHVDRGDAGASLSWNHSNPTARTGPITGMPSTLDAQTLFKKIFVPLDNGTTTVVARKPIVDRVLESYRNLRNGNRRLSVVDRQRIDDHMARLNELERRLNVTSGPNVAGCKASKIPADTAPYRGKEDPVNAGKVHQLMNDVVAAAFACGSSRIATIAAQGPFTNYAGSWHQDVAHQNTAPGSQDLLMAANREFFVRVYLDLVSKLDGIQNEDGTTVLDDSMVNWVHESGEVQHQAVSMPIVSAGSAGGFFKTGVFADYRNLNVRVWKDPRWEFSGLTYNRWLATILDSMGIARSEWETPQSQGYGLTIIGEGWTRAATGTQVMTEASRPMPFIVA
jgi:Protein of unknown function (DUF1552)